MKDNEAEHNSLAVEIIKEEKTLIKRLEIISISESIVILLLVFALFKILL